MGAYFATFLILASGIKKVATSNQSIFLLTSSGEFLTRLATYLFTLLFISSSFLYASGKSLFLIFFANKAEGIYCPKFLTVLASSNPHNPPAFRLFFISSPFISSPSSLGCLSSSIHLSPSDFLCFHLSAISSNTLKLSPLSLTIKLLAKFLIPLPALCHQDNCGGCSI